MSGRAAEWIVAGPAPYLGSCLRCGGHIDPPPDGARLRASALLGLMRGFIAAHERCRERRPVIVWARLGQEAHARSP